MTAVEHIPDITATPAWSALRKHHAQIGTLICANCSTPTLIVPASST